MSEELRDAEVRAWARDETPGFTSDHRKAHFVGFMAGVKYARRTPSPATRAMMFLVKGWLGYVTLSKQSTETIEAFIAEWQPKRGLSPQSAPDSEKGDE